eukprot:229608_1
MALLDVKNSLIRAKQANQHTKNAVFGYVRRFQDKAPSIIQYLCLCYYLDMDYFSKHASHFTVNDRRDIVTSMLKLGKYGFQKWGSVYGDVAITNDSPVKFRWTFKILQSQFFRSDMSSIYIGIDSSNKTHYEGYFWNNVLNRNNWYAYGGSSPYRYCDWIDYENIPKGKPIRKDDIIKMEVNVVDKTISYTVNEEDLGIIFDNIILEKRTYNLAICLTEENDSVQIINFEKQFI